MVLTTDVKAYRHDECRQKQKGRCDADRQLLMCVVVDFHSV